MVKLYAKKQTNFHATRTPSKIKESELMQHQLSVIYNQKKNQ